MKNLDPHEGMIPYGQALELIRSSVAPLGAETVPLARARGRYLATPVKARHQLPRFDQSAMDGFAVRREDLLEASGAAPVALEIVGELAAGDPRRPKLGADQTAKVFTGGLLPRGADAVVMKEYVIEDEDEALFAACPGAGDHIRRAGEELERGDVILKARTRVTPPVIGLLAANGLKEANVVRAPTVTVITMGDELVAPGRPLSAGKIHDANGPALRAALQAVGITRVRVRRVRDRIGVLQRALASSLANSDLVITVGGASVGEHDHVAGARSLLGVKELFHRVAVKPGKPNIFGLSPDGVPVFGLPGNPVSALVSFHQLVRPLIAVLMGAPPWVGRTVPVTLSEAAHKKPGRAHWLRGTLKRRGANLEAELMDAQGSHMLSGLAYADILAELPAGAEEVGTDEVLRAWLLDWEKF